MLSKKDDRSYIIVNKKKGESDSLFFLSDRAFLFFDFIFIDSIELNRELSVFLSPFVRFLHYFSTRKEFRFSRFSG